MCTMAKVFVDIILKFILSTPSFNLVLFVFSISSLMYPVLSCVTVLIVSSL